MIQDLKNQLIKRNKMDRIAPKIIRQQYVIEGYYNIKVDEEAIDDYFDDLAHVLMLEDSGFNTLFSSQEDDLEEDESYFAFRSFLASGVSLSIWNEESFLSVIIFAHKPFDEKKALAFTRKFFRMEDHIAKDF